MNLIIDIGNTSVKTAIFEEGSIKVQYRTKLSDLVEHLKTLVRDFPEIKNSILSNVGNMPENTTLYIRETFENLILLDRNTKLPFKNDYKTPKTLGVDRIALVTAAACLHPEKDVLVIDAGTCITYDFKDKSNTYKGGAIAPGFTLRYKSLNDYTANLPLLSLNEDHQLIGQSTEESIHSGIINGICSEIDGIIDRYCNIYPHLTVILTGGDAHFLSKRLKNSIFATSNFLLEGLNHILAFNTSQ